MYKKNDIVTIRCYGKEQKMSREDAKKFYLTCMACSEGSERERYTNVYLDLEDGLDYCTDRVD